MRNKNQSETKIKINKYINIKKAEKVEITVWGGGNNTSQWHPQAWWTTASLNDKDLHTGFLKIQLSYI